LYLNAGALKRSNSWKTSPKVQKVKQLDRIFNLGYIVMFWFIN
jgi:hypothetical protein